MSGSPAPSPLPDTQISEVTMTVKWEHKKLSCCVLWSSASGIDVFIICMLDKFIKIIVKITRLDVLLEAGRAGIINTSLAWFKEFDSLQRKSFVTAEASQIFHSDFNLFFISFRIFWFIFLAGTEKRETLRGPFDILHVVWVAEQEQLPRSPSAPCLMELQSVCCPEPPVSFLSSSTSHDKIRAKSNKIPTNTFLCRVWIFINHRLSCTNSSFSGPRTHLLLLLLPGLDWGQLSSAFLNYKIRGRNVARGRTPV